MRIPITALATAVLLLTGCTMTMDGVEIRPLSGCTDDMKKTAATADWSNAEVLEVSIKGWEFSNGMLEMETGKPYIIKFTNNDSFFSRWFRAREFFRNVSMRKMVHDGKEVAGNCPDAVALAPSKSAEFHLVPMKAGYYEFEDSPFLSPPIGEIVWNSDIGYIYVR